MKVYVVYSDTLQNDLSNIVGIYLDENTAESQADYLEEMNAEDYYTKEFEVSEESHNEFRF